MYLLDTNVVSELRRRRPHGGLVGWLESVQNDALFLSVVTLGELQAGAEITREQDPKKAREIEAWIDQVMEAYNVLPMDARTFRVWGRLLHRKPDELVEDGMIAATAIVHNLTVATRNVADFRRLGVGTFDPFRGEAHRI